MNQADLGINPATKRHDKRLTGTESRFLSILWTDHVGETNKISADELAVRFDFATDGVSFDDTQASCIIERFRKQPWFDKKKRTVRHLHNHLLTMHDRVPILSKAGISGGYWMSGDKQEAAAFYDTFRKRGITGLVKAARGKKSVLIDMMQQLTFEFEDLSLNVGVVDKVDTTKDSAAIAVVDSFLERMLADPEKFAGGLRKLSKKYGSILLDKTEVAAMKAKAAELSTLVEALGC